MREHGLCEFGGGHVLRDRHGHCRNDLRRRVAEHACAEDVLLFVQHQLHDAVAALVFRLADPDGLRRALQNACDRPDSLEPLRAAAPERVRKRFDWDDVVRRTLLAYQGKPDEPPAES